MRSVLLALVAGAILMGCTDATRPSGSPSATAPIPTLTPAPTTTLPPVATPPPTVAPSPTATPGVTETTWSRAANSPLDRLHQASAIAWTGSRFVVAGIIERVVPERSEGIAFWTSQDGVAWTMGSERSGGSVSDFAFDASGSGVAIGILGSEIAAWSSPDGISWVKAPDQAAFVPQGTETGLEMYGVSRTGSGFVAIGVARMPDPGRAVVLTSPDGVVWTRMPLDPAFSGVRLDDIAGVGGRVVLVGHVRSPFRNLIWTSVDGRTWSQVPDLSGVDPTDNRSGTYQVAAGPAGILVTLRAPDRAWLSADGATWASTPELPVIDLKTYGMNAFATPTGFIAVGYASGCTSGLWVSPDATSWACVAGGPPAVGRGDWIVAASGNAIVTSADVGSLWVANLGQ